MLIKGFVPLEKQQIQKSDREKGKFERLIESTVCFVLCQSFSRKNRGE